MKPMAADIHELIEANRARGYVFVWQIDAVPGDHDFETFLALETAGIDVVGEEELQVPDGDDQWMIELQEVESLPRLTRSREAELAAVIRSGGSEAEQGQREFLKGNLRMAAFTALRHTPPGGAIQQRVAEADMALAHAMIGFDFNRASRFSSYATWFVRRYFILGGNDENQNSGPAV